MYLGQCLQMQSEISEGNKVICSLSFFLYCLLTKQDRGAIQTMQAYGATIFKLVPIFSLGIT
jgi:hypothetical protein